MESSAEKSAEKTEALYFKNGIKSRVQDAFDQQNLIWIQMPLSHFDFGNGTSCDIAPQKLQLRRQSILGHMLGFPELPYVVSDSGFNLLVHATCPLHLY